MDADNREILALERYTDGKAVKADIFDHPVSYNVNEITHTGDVHEALAASLNRYGEANMEYMESLTDKPQSQLLEELRGRVFYNPLAKRFEIADRFIAGNVVAKAEYIEEYLRTHPDDAESRISLDALRRAAPTPIPFEELDFNFGERWIPAAVYSRYASWLFDTDVSVRYNASADEYNIRASELSPRILQPVCRAFRNAPVQRCRPHAPRHPQHHAQHHQDHYGQGRQGHQGARPRSHATGQQQD